MNNPKWRVHTGNLIKEMASFEVLKHPANILKELLVKVGERCAEIDDKKLNELMCRLTIYAIADPEDKDYDPKAVEEIFKK